MARPRSFTLKALITMAPLGGIMRAAPMPWIARAVMMKASDSAKPQAAEATRKTTAPSLNTRPWPKISASRPPTATNAASASR